MKTTKFAIFLAVLIVFSPQVYSAPSALNIDQSQKNRVQDRYIKAAHGVLKHKLSLAEVRFAILNAALDNKGVKWILEQDGDGFMVLRWDYAEAVIYSKVEYDDQHIQLKYVDAYGDFRCTNNIDGICYRNENKNFYAYMKKLKTSISRLL